MAGGILAALIGPLLVIWVQNLVNSKLYIGSFISIFIIQIITLILLLFLSIPNPIKEEKFKKNTSLVSIIKESKFVLSILSGVGSNGAMVFIMTATPLAMAGHHHNINDTALSMQIHLLGMFAPSFFTGHLIAKFNPMKIMICGAVIILTSIAINMAQFSLFNISFSMLLLGLGWNFMNISSTTLLTEDCTAENQAITQAIYEFIILSSMAFFVYLSGWTISKFGWIHLNILSILIFIVLFLGIAITTQRKRCIAI